ncbi:hypothetical protein FHT44_004955 [Mycolicibacterium sp. BK634]|uniref:hypothetical protein n=1 Tax=Mycolicibacterium sp. BK634 TaxID=2587099 RepID=UPI00162298F8|nr:hypothetical protein [Mycolicibacterium sp. BK634]MBB3752443.1 hypothetical protein [Mycolicibacterium sp. BK634]
MRRLLRLLLSWLVGDIYVVMHFARVVTATTTLQGAEVARTKEAERIFKARFGEVPLDSRAQYFYNQMRIVNVDLQDI